MTNARTYILHWQGPFALLDSEAQSLFDAPAAIKCGLYILTSEYRHGYLIYAAGWTTRPFARRMREHIRQYRKGTYTVLDAASLRRGFRKELWHGMWTKKDTNTPQMKALFQSRKAEIQPTIDQLLSTFRVFLAPLKKERRVLARIEAAIMEILLSKGGRVSSIPDRGMSLAPRRPDEPYFTVLSASPPFLHGLPERFNA